MDPRHKVQTGPPNHWRRRAEPWQVTGWLLLFSLLFSRFGQGTGQVGPNERETGVSLIPGEGERKGFPSHDTVGAMNPVPHGQGRPLQNDPENADQEPDLGHTDKSMSPLGLYNTLLFLEVDGGGLHMIKHCLRRSRVHPRRRRSWSANFQEKGGELVSCKFMENDDYPWSGYFASTNTIAPTKSEPRVQNKLLRSAQQPVVRKENSALSLMLDYARDRNLSKCWLCQNMPASIHSPMSNPIPFTKADYETFNWNDLASRFREEADDCYTPTYPVDVKSSQNTDIALYVARTVNDKYLPSGFNFTTLLRIIHIQRYVKLGFEYRVQVALAQTNCSKPSENQVCVPQPYTTTAMAEALVYVQPWAGTLTIGPVKIQLRNCSAPQQNEQRPQRDCSTYLPPVFTHELQNVSLCFRGIGKGHEDLGQSSCNTVVDVTLKQSPLPERVYLVCGDRAYRCVPYEDSRGVCYLAYLIPLIREVESTEIASLYPPLHIYKREISSTQKVASFLLPWYGVYVSQQELSSLSKVLENHLNASSRAMLAEHKELQEVKTVALQNRMALDLLLAAQGGTCKLIGSECCSYISDATADVMDMAHDTALGIKELHDSHGFNLGDFSGVFGSWGSGLVRFLTTLAVAVFLFILLCSCVGLIIKLVVKKTTGSVLQAAQVHVTGNTADHNHTGLRYYDFETFQDWMRRFHPGIISDEEEETQNLGSLQEDGFHITMHRMC
ncbi:uncharacterized protein LOC122971009 isoform X2 [Thunnus albacares]|uniref:uncharacterized protein LOC122971009 isoform X2 n=1 Tax=Thunnus albacares TaxID=8236 RepID=UPI001CF61270|nr:uncharacterized protein LOC122971009 isoform X2 [Thunnus albacares]